MEITTIGLDLAKQVFQVHGVDAAGQSSCKRRLRRAQVITFFAALPALSGRHGSLRHRALLGARAALART